MTEKQKQKLQDAWNLHCERLIAEMDEAKRMAELFKILREKIKQGNRT
jgi:hypothetical protein